MLAHIIFLTHFRSILIVTISLPLAVLEGLTVGERIVTEGGFPLRAEWLKLHPSGQ